MAAAGVAAGESAGLLKFVPQGHEKALKVAFYNTAANVFVVSVCVAAFAVFFILQAFLRPLLWAVLLGVFLHPFKTSLTASLRTWLEQLQACNAPLAVGVALLPLQVVSVASETIVGTIVKRWRVLLAVAVLSPLLVIVYQYAPFQTLIQSARSTAFLLYNGLGYFNAFWVYSLALAYLLLVAFYWTPQSSPILRALGAPVWVVIILHIVTIAGDYRVLVLAAVITLAMTGFISELADRRKAGGGDDDRDVISLLSITSMFSRSSPSQAHEPTQAETTSETEANKGEEDTQASEEKKGADKEVPDKKGLTKKKLSDHCFVALFWFVVGVRLYSHVWLLLQLLPIPIAVVLLKRFGMRFVQTTWLVEAHGQVENWLSARQDVLAPKPLRGLVKLISRGDKKINSMLVQSMDRIMSIGLIVMVFVGAVLLAILLTFQVHKESMHLVSVTSKFVEETMENHPEFSQWLPESKAMEGAVNSVLGNAYLYSREWIAQSLNSMFAGKDMAEKQVLEKQFLEVWDEMYRAWVVRDVSASESALTPSAGAKLLAASPADVWNQVSNLGVGHFNDIRDFVTDNLDTLSSILTGVWSVLVSNVSVAISAVSAVLRLLLGGGTAVLNFVISLIIFFTTLLILLSSSGDSYAPLEWFSKLTPGVSGGGTAAGRRPGGGALSRAVEEGISGVFMASLKMAAFYLLYTWHTHLLFELNIVFVPAALAAVFAVVPMLGTYWAAVPGILELYLSGRTISAISLGVLQFLPTMFVDTAIYSDIKGGGHPYLTGLAIAGGLFWLGFEGAIVGPILLCCLHIAVNVYGSMLRADAILDTPLPRPNSETPRFLQPLDLKSRSKTTTFG